MVCKKIEIVTTLSELAGYKTGIALNKKEIESHLPEEVDLWNGLDDGYVSVRSEVYEEMLFRLLYRLGNIPIQNRLQPGIALYWKYKDNKKMSAISYSLSELWLEMMPKLIQEAEQSKQPVDLMPFVEEASRRFQTQDGLKILREFLDALVLFLHSGLTLNIRRQEWVDTVELANLFESELLETYYGHFFDQRFIDYLNINFGSIDHVNWRKFEGLAAEYFDREGFYVEIGPGRNDESVDIRIWPKEENRSSPPAMLVQCKRQRQKIEKVVVKALYADILAEGAESGLIVTTSMLSPGAEKVCLAHAYPIMQANRGTLKDWINLMRSPYTGVFLGE